MFLSIQFGKNQITCSKSLAMKNGLSLGANDLKLNEIPQDN